MKSRRDRGRGPWVFLWCWSACVSAGCSDDPPPSPQPSAGSGGAGGIGEAVPLGGKSGSDRAGSGGSGDTFDACAGTSPAKLSLIDDFDDGDSVAAFEAGREAYWFTIDDGTDGTLEPSGEFVPEPGGYQGSLAAHVSAASFSDWGAALVANLSHKTAIRCPFNASGFEGIRFIARGHGRIRLQLAMPEVVAQEFGGKCDPNVGKPCYDHHGLFITLTDELELYEVRWSQLTQRGFGESVTFDPKTLMSLYFSMERADLPVELWVDQVELWDGVPGRIDRGGAGGAAPSDGGASGAGPNGGGAGPSEGGAGGGAGEGAGGASAATGGAE